MCFAGAMQSWGTQSRFGLRETGLEPSKSGVVGLLCAALGKPRDEREGDGFPTLAALAALRLGVRVDRPGVMLKDYQTIGGGMDAKANAILSRRFYLADASFLVGLEARRPEEEFLLGLLHGKEKLAGTVHGDLRRPHWQLCLGRKAFVPGESVWLPDDEWSKLSLDEALRGYEWLSDEHNALPESLRVVIDAQSDDAEAETRMDVPVSFAARQFGVRYVKTDFIACPLLEARARKEALRNVSFKINA